MSRIKTKFYEDNSVTNAKLAQMAAHTYKGNNTASTANATDVTSTQLTADLNLFTSSLQGLVPSSGGGTTNFLRADGTFANPISSLSLTSAHLFVGNGSNVATDVAVSGDLTLANTGAFTIATNAVSNSKFRQSAALSVVGNSTNATADVADITGTTDQVLRVSSAGTTLGFGAINLASSSAVSGILANANTTATSNATASTIMLRDANANSRINSLIEGFTTTATAAGTTTLTVGSTYAQQFTGSTTQTVVLPDATTLVVGQAFMIMNRSTGVVTVNKNGGSLVQTMAAGSQTIVTVTDIGSAAGSWDSAYSVTSSGAGGLTTTVVTADTTMVAGNRYIVNKSGTAAIMTLPATSSVGDEIAIVGVGSGGWQILSNASASAQTLNTNGATAGPSSSSAISLRISTSNNDAIHLICVTANTVWNVVDYVGTSAPQFITSATGGTITTDGDYKVHTFTSSGTFQVITGTAPVASLVVAGGGGGGGNGSGGGGGGGAGGFTYTTPGATYTVGSFTVTVGAGGANDTNGGNSVFDTITSTGGGSGATYSANGGNGGSGGGGAAQTSLTTTGGTGTVGQGNNGGNGGGVFGGGGGGGASAAGGNGGSGTGGNGGNGTSNSITGSAVTYAGGGGGATASGTPGTGGTGGGGAGSTGNGTAGTANTGGGGGGSSGTGAVGGSGVVILRYRFQ